MNKTIISIVIIVIIILLSGYLLVNNSYRPVPATPQIQQPINQTTSTTSPSQQPQGIPASTVTAPKTYTVSIKNFVFNQKTIHIKKGDTVVWKNEDATPHTVTGNNGGPVSGTLNNGETYSFTFNDTGTFNYYCVFHPSMTGSVVVTK